MQPLAVYHYAADGRPPLLRASFRDAALFRQRLPRRAQKCARRGNDKKVVGFLLKPTTFIFVLFESVAERHRIVSRWGTASRKR